MMLESIRKLMAKCRESSRVHSPLPEAAAPRAAGPLTLVAFAPGLSWDRGWSARRHQAAPQPANQRPHPAHVRDLGVGGADASRLAAEAGAGPGRRRSGGGA